MAKTVIKLNVPLDAHPDVVRGPHLEKSPLHASLRAAMTDLYDTWGRVADLADKVKDKTLLAQRAQPSSSALATFVERMAGNLRAWASEDHKLIDRELGAEQ